MKKIINKRSKRLAAILMAFLMVLTAIPMTVINANAEATDEGGYIEVRTIEDLYNIRNDLNANYILMNDIDLTDATAEGGTWDYNNSGWNPIGSNDIYGTTEFSGIFDGNGHKIYGLRINIETLPADVGDVVYIGLFSNITGSVKNLELYGNIDYIGDRAFVIGAISGACDGQIINCKNHINISGTGTSTTINGYVGGLVGQATDNTVIANCSNYGAVSSIRSNDDTEDRVSTNNSAGGIVGNSSENVEISMCYNTGEVVACTHYNKVWRNGSYGGAGSYSYYGGYAISSGIAVAGNINDCYNTGDILAKEHGSTTNITHLSTYAIGGVATRCYSSGAVSTKGTDYGLSSTGTQCYYLVNSCSSSSGATSLTEAQMKIESMYKGFDFENIWVLNEFANHPYPQLRSNIQDMSESASLVSIITLPNKLNYMTGDKLDFTGAIVKVVYVSGKEETIAITEDIVSGFDMSIAGEQAVTVTVSGASDTYTINVIERPTVENVVISSEPNTKQFAIGTAFDFTGAKATVYYVGGIVETVNITPEMTAGGNINHIGKQTIIVTFGEKSASFEIEVLGLALDKIEITNLPTKTEYLEGQELDLSGLVITAVMNNGIKNIVATGYTVSGYSSTPGTHTVTITYLEKIATFEIAVSARKIVSLSLNSLPTKTEYISGQEFDTNGMQVIATYDNGDVIVAENYTISGFDSIPGIKNIIISLDNKQVSFPVNVIARVVTDFELVSLPSKLSYIEYEPFDKTGLSAKATYNDGKTEEVFDFDLTGISTNVGTHTVLVSYEGFVRTFEITVSERLLEKLIVTAPTKTTYYIGETFERAGLTVTACYNNGQQILIDEYSISGFDSNSAGVKTITVSYGGLTYDLAVAIAERSALETDGEIKVGNVIARLGENVLLPISISKNLGLSGFCHTITFDTSNLKYVGVKLSEAFADGTVIVNTEKSTAGEITVLWFGTKDVTASGDAYYIEFTVLETATDGNTWISIAFDENDNGNASGENVLFDAIAGNVEIRSYWLGDVNGDREYHMADLLQIAQYVAGEEMTLTEKQQLSADVNEDTIIDIHDVIMLQQWIIAAGVPEA